MTQQSMVSTLRRAARRTAHSLLNNVLINNVTIWLRLEGKLKNWQHPYRHFRPNSSKSLQENAGFSDRPEINEAVRKVHDSLRRVAESYLHSSNRKWRVLDIGCGPGLYLQDFNPELFNVTGLDLNAAMCDLARQNAVRARVMQRDFMSADFVETFDFIYLISMLQYIGRTQVARFFEKLADLLEPGGVLFLNYPHAISFRDLLCPDLKYIQYSPRLVERLAGRSLTVLEHRHAFDGRRIDLYDHNPYPSLNPKTDKTTLNSSLLVARKKCAGQC